MRRLTLAMFGVVVLVHSVLALAVAGEEREGVEPYAYRGMASSYAEPNPPHAGLADGHGATAADVMSSVESDVAKARKERGVHAYLGTSPLYGQSQTDQRHGTPSRDVLFVNGTESSYGSIAGPDDGRGSIAAGPDDVISSVESDVEKEQEKRDVDAYLGTHPPYGQVDVRTAARYDLLGQRVAR